MTFQGFGLPGELQMLADTIAEFIHEIRPVEARLPPGRACTTWAGFLRSRAGAPLACDFLETVTLSGARMFVPAVRRPDAPHEFDYGAVGADLPS
jgi:hypothetical protein